MGILNNGLDELGRMIANTSGSAANTDGSTEVDASSMVTPIGSRAPEPTPDGDKQQDQGCPEVSGRGGSKMGQ